MPEIPCLELYQFFWYPIVPKSILPPNHPVYYYFKS
ncbi:unnamed protein product [Tenebrio molitor]|nr:unnamed protein product [Tenebrio molitor]